MTPARRACGRRGCGRFAGRRSRRSPGRRCALGAGHRLLRWRRGCGASHRRRRHRAPPPGSVRAAETAPPAAGDRARGAIRTPRAIRAPRRLVEKPCRRRRLPPTRAEHQVRPARAVHVVVAISLLSVSQTLVGRGRSAMPKVSWSSTRFCVTRFSRPPFTTMPIPYDGYCRSNAGADVVVVVHPVAGDQGARAAARAARSRGVRHDAAGCFAIRSSPRTGRRRRSCPNSPALFSRGPR